MTDLIALGMPEELGGLDLLKTSLTSIAKNARSLLSDAELLFDHGRYARATALAVLAVEEVGKCLLLERNTAEAEQAMPLNQFVSETLDLLGTDADEILVEAAKPLRANPGPEEHALVNGFNQQMLKLFAPSQA